MRILMLGNSLTTANGLPELLSQHMGCPVVVHARGGARLSEHLNPATKLGAQTREALAAGGISYVVLQEMSNGPVRSRERFLDAVCALADATRAAGAVPVLYGTWAHAPGCPKLEKLGLSHEQMHAAMHEANMEAARRADLALADAGSAFFAHPDKLGLYAPDGVHPSPVGSQLALMRLAQAVRDAGTESPAAETAYTVYLLRCQDGSYYAGITTCLERRLQEHRSRGPKAARYTRTHPVEALAASWEAADRTEASRLEYRIKRLDHRQKEALAANPALIEGLRSPGIAAADKG